MSSSTVRVEFMNVTTGSLFGICDLPAENLPEAFDAPTTLSIQGEDWKVVEAEPQAKDSFRKTGRLRLHLTRVPMPDPAEVMYSLPSVTKQLPVIEQNSTYNPRDLEIHEDDWRQMEFVSLAFANEMEKSLDEIRRVHTECWKRVGWTRMHVRKEIAHPLQGTTLFLDEVKALCPISKRFNGLRFEGATGRVADSFAFTTVGGMTFYGRSDDGILRELCMMSKRFETPMVEVNAIQKILQRHNLVLVNWCRLQTLRWDMPNFPSEFAYCVL
ncbi:MAG: hypothetical protein ACAI35_18865 [Candidatus Methylacidiphilales bacterium]|nr:hypothetical protein [Candidatus Methylacidiphilales bacterium]